MLCGEPSMKRFCITTLILLIVLTASANVKADPFSDTWSIRVTTGPGQPTTPLNSTGLLTLANFSVLSTGQISDLAFNASISELSFWENFSASDGYINATGFNTIIFGPFVNWNTLNNQTLLIFVNVDGQGKDYFSSYGNSNSFEFSINPGEHFITYDITVIVQPSNTDPPGNTVPEFPTIALLALLAIATLSVVVIRRKHTEDEPTKPGIRTCIALGVPRN